MSRQKPAGLGTFPLEFAALGLLFTSPKHGYLLYREFVEEFYLIWKAGQANFYAALARLEDTSNVTVSLEAQEDNPPRKVFRVTETGRANFINWLNTPVDSMRAFRVEFLARLRFFSLLGLPGADTLIQQEIVIVQHWLDEWSTDALSSNPATAMVVDFRTRQAGMILDWLAACQAKIEQATLPF